MTSSIWCLKHQGVGQKMTTIWHIQQGVTSFVNSPLLLWHTPVCCLSTGSRHLSATRSHTFLHLHTRHWRYGCGQLHCGRGGSGLLHWLHACQLYPGFAAGANFASSQSLYREAFRKKQKSGKFPIFSPFMGMVSRIWWLSHQIRWHTFTHYRVFLLTVTKRIWKRCRHCFRQCFFSH